MTYRVRKIITIIYSTLVVAVLFAMLVSPQEKSSYNDDTAVLNVEYFNYIENTICDLDIDITNDDLKMLRYVYVTVSFYDENDYLITTKTARGIAYIDGWLRGSGNETVNVYFGTVYDLVESYSIDKVEYEYDGGFIWIYVVGALVQWWLVAALLLNHKTYYYEQDKHRIKVIAGFFTHRLEIDGITVDEYKAFFYWKIELKSQKENMNVEVKIGQGFLGNTVSTKVNGIVINGTTRNNQNDMGQRTTIL